MANYPSRHPKLTHTQVHKYAHPANANQKIDDISLNATTLTAVVFSK